MILCSCPLIQILINLRDLGLLFGSLFCFIGLCVCSYASTRLFAVALQHSLISGIVISPTMFFCLKIAGVIWGILGFHIKF